MTLTNSQYNQIIRSYEEKQRQTRLQLERNTELVHSKIPEYEDFERQVSSLSIAQGRKLLSGDTNALSELKTQLAKISAEKKQLLRMYQFPEDFLEPKYECPICQDTGYVNNIKCQCFKKAEIDLVYEQSTIKELLKTDNFSTLSYEYYAQDDLARFQKAVQECQNFVNTFGKDYHNLLFYGTVGTGKSFLSSCVAQELINQGKLVIYFSATQLFEVLSRCSFDKDSKEANSGVYEDIYDCDLLIIDDLGTELTNAFVSSQLFTCINNRHLRKKPTIITSNLSLEEMATRYSDRIFSRITSYYEIFKITGIDIRLAKRKSLLKRK